jgi:hypothetical protein
MSECATTFYGSYSEEVVTLICRHERQGASNLEEKSKLQNQIAYESETEQAGPVKVDKGYEYMSSTIPGYARTWILRELDMEAGWARTR